MRTIRLRAGLVGVVLTGIVLTAGAQDARLTPEQQRTFLLNASVQSSRPIGKGVTASLRLTLTDGTTTHDAAFQTIDDRASMEDRRQARRRAGELNFVDSYHYNIAAYEIARLLGLDDMMPVTVERGWRGRKGSLTWWVDDVLMDEAERETSPLRPPSALAFQRQRMRMQVFSEFIGDVDRNKGNILYTQDWGVVMIDFTRGFRLHREPRQAAALTSIERRLWERLQQITRDEIREATGDDHLTLEELGALMARQRALVEHYRQLIAQRGEDVVIY